MQVKRIILAAAMALTLIVGATAMQSQTAHAATGDFVAGVNFSTQCGSGLGVGIAYDGVNLWYSCTGGTYDLLRADPNTGVVNASYNISNGLGSLAYDGVHNVLYAGSWCQGTVSRIVLDANKNVTSSAPLFSAAGYPCDDGIAYDAQDDTIYYSPDTSTTIYHYSTTGALLDSRAWAGTGCYNSGLAIGGQLLFEGSDGCSKVVVVDKTTNVVQFTFSTAVANDPNFRDEGLSCDPNTFAAQGKQVMWSKEAYAPMRAHAYEVPAGTCGVGGKPATDSTPPSCSLKSTGVNASGQKYIVIATQDSDGGLAASPKGIVVTASSNVTVSIPPYTAGATTEVDVTATKINQSLGASISLQVTDAAGNVTNCDPALLNLSRDQGKPASTTAHGIAKSERWVHVYNGTPGVTTLSLSVNGKNFQVSGLAAGATRTIDVGSALVAGSNSITLTATGTPGGSVIAIVADR